MDELQKNKSLNIVISIIGILIIAITGILIFYINQNRSQSLSNSDSAYLSPPITQLAKAKIMSKSKDSITVNVSSPFQSDSTTQTVDLKININEGTNIASRDIMIPYLFSQTNPIPSSSAKFTIDDLLVNEVVNILLVEDLRFTAKNNLIAQNIIRNANSNTLSGLITEINQNTIKIKGSSLTSISEMAIYTTTFSSDTEISIDDIKGSQRLNLSDLTVGSLVTIYSTSPITDNSFTVALISVQPNLVPPANPTPSN